MQFLNPQAFFLSEDNGINALYVLTYFNRVNVKATNFKLVASTDDSIEIELHTENISFLPAEKKYIHPVTHAVDLSGIDLTTIKTIELSIYEIPIIKDEITSTARNNGNGTDPKDTPKPKKAGTTVVSTASADEDLRPITIIA